MTEQDYWWRRSFDPKSGSQELNNFFHRIKSEGYIPHLIFIEEGTEILDIKNIDGPDGAMFAKSMVTDYYKNGDYRFRASAVDAQRLLRSIKNFTDDLSKTVPDENQRLNRRNQLTQFFQGAGHSPVIDIYARGDEKMLPALRFALAPGTWHIMLFQHWNKSVPPIHLSLRGETLFSNERSDAEVFELKGYYPIPPWLEMRLIDIFSLNHVADAEINDEGEADHKRRGTPDLGGSGGTAPLQTAHQEALELIEQSKKELESQNTEEERLAQEEWKTVVLDNKKNLKGEAV